MLCCDCGWNLILSYSSLRTGKGNPSTFVDKGMCRWHIFFLPYLKVSQKEQKKAIPTLKVMQAYYIPRSQKESKRQSTSLLLYSVWDGALTPLVSTVYKIQKFMPQFFSPYTSRNVQNHLVWSFLKVVLKSPVKRQKYSLKTFLKRYKWHGQENFKIDSNILTTNQKKCSWYKLCGTAVHTAFSIYAEHTFLKSLQ